MMVDPNVQSCSNFGQYIFYVRCMFGPKFWNLFMLLFFFSLRVLEMFGCFKITPKGMRYLATHCINLLTLNLGQCYKVCYWTCPLIFPFLRVFYDCLKRYFHNIEFRKERFLLGFKEESLTLNLLILIPKYYIYKCKLKEKIPNIIELKYRIKNYYSLEQYIAKKNSNLKDFEKYWTPVKHVFPDF